jgi:hypothetical protein
MNATLAVVPKVSPLSPAELDKIGKRLEDIAVEEEYLRAQVKEQIEHFGFTPARAEKSKRVVGAAYQFTLSSGSTTEIKDAEVEKIRAVCPEEFFSKLFRVVTKFKLADGAGLVLADKLPAKVPTKIRQMFSRAVETKETAARLRIEPLAKK